jgi:ribosome-associated translation inhibitor RaiA
MSYTIKYNNLDKSDSIDLFIEKKVSKITKFSWVEDIKFELSKNEINLFVCKISAFIPKHGDIRCETTNSDILVSITDSIQKTVDLLVTIKEKRTSH